MSPFASPPLPVTDADGGGGGGGGGEEEGATNHAYSRLIFTIICVP